MPGLVFKRFLFESAMEVHLRVFYTFAMNILDTIVEQKRREVAQLPARMKQLRRD